MKVVYPFEGQLDPEKIQLWYQDAVTDGVITPPPPTVRQQAIALHEAGIITLVNDEPVKEELVPINSDPRVAKD